MKIPVEPYLAQSRQWPQHGERRAIQLGLRGRALASFARDELLEVIDFTDFVASQRPFAQNDNPALLTPSERVFPHPA